MNNRDEQPASDSRAAEAYVVDLTSVCVRSGTVRLPLSLIGRFSEGEQTARADGEELTLTFRAPRTLEGLAPFFERNDLKSNDRVRFEFGPEGLVLRAVRRERSRRSSPGQANAADKPHAGVKHDSARGAGSPASSWGTSDARSAEALRGAERNASAERSASDALASERRSSDTRSSDARPSDARSTRLTARGMFPAPAHLMDSADVEERARNEAALEAQGSQEAERSHPEQWNDTSVRAVRRVRIEGGTPPRTDTPAPRPIDRASARDVWARRQNPAWRSLDAIVAGPAVSPEEAADEFSGTTVRVVKRSQGISVPLEAEQAPARPEPKQPGHRPATRAETTEAERKAPASYATSWPLDDRRREERAAERAKRAANPPEQAERAQLDPYLDAPIDADREREQAERQTILESDLLSIPGAANSWRDVSEEAYQKYQQEQGEAERTTVQRERRPGLLGRLGLSLGGGRSEAPRSASSSNANRAPSDADEVEDRRQPAATPSSRRQQEDSSEQRSQAQTWGRDGGPQISATTLVAEPKVAPARNEAVSAPRAHAEPQAQPQASSGSSSASQLRVIVDESVYDVDFDTEVEHAQKADPANMSTLETDMARLNGYFEMPDVPAIVRCDDLAERLSISLDRVTRAMTRLSEDRERFTPLRGDAYMVRRAR